MTNGSGSESIAAYICVFSHNLIAIDSDLGHTNLLLRILAFKHGHRRQFLTLQKLQEGSAASGDI